MEPAHKEHPFLNRGKHAVTPNKRLQLAINELRQLKIPLIATAGFSAGFEFSTLTCASLLPGVSYLWGSWES